MEKEISDINKMSTSFTYVDHQPVVRQIISDDISSIGSN